MKLIDTGKMISSVSVTLCVRVWIEIKRSICNSSHARVTLCVRVWIEIRRCEEETFCNEVTLCVRVWIEINWSLNTQRQEIRHPLREGVD